MDATYVGIDVSKERLDVHVLPSNPAFAVARDGKGIGELSERPKTLLPTAVAVEATGGFETVVAAGPGSAGLPVAIVNPAQVRAFARALGKRAKTDPLRRRAPGHAVRHRRNQACAYIHRKRSRHAGWPPSPACILSRKPKPVGVLRDSLR